MTHINLKRREFLDRQLKHMWVLHFRPGVKSFLHKRKIPVKARLIKPLSAAFKVIIHPLPNESYSLTGVPACLTPKRMGPPTFPTSTKVATSLHPGAKTSLALITMGATAWEKCCRFKINVIVCHRKPIWLLFLLSCAHLTPHTGPYLRMWFSFSLPGEGETDTSRFHLY